MLICNSSAWESTPSALAAAMMTVNAPPSVGVPVIWPVAGLPVTPAGKPVALKLVGVWLARMV